MSEPKLRPMTPEDLSALFEIFRETAVEGDAYAHDETTTRDEFAAYWLGRGGEQWVALEDERIVGGYTVRANHPGRGAHVATASYVVATRARGRGIGGRMGVHSIERAAVLEFTHMQFNLVVSTNEAAVRLWTKLGFRITGTLPKAYRHARLGDVDAYVMTRELAPPKENCAIDGRVHHQVIAAFVRDGHPPTASEIAAALELSPDAVARSLRRLHEGHGLVLHPDSLDVWIAHPFSASPSAVWIAANERGWWAPCLWCAMGVVALAAPTATLHARIAGEHEELRIGIREGALLDRDLVVHFPVPPRAAWSNVVHWCASVLPFRDADQIAAWCARHRLPQGAIVPIDQVLALGRAWYGRHLDEDWKKWSIAEAQAIFEEVGLRGEFWKLPVSDRPF